MTKNHREIFYSNYNSKFNSIVSRFDEKIIKSLYEHYDYKIYPLIKNYKPESKILELGCGPGHLLGYLKSKNFDNIIGIDISKEQLLIAKSKGLNVLEIDAIKFLSNSLEKYDIIFAFDFIEHFTKEELVLLTSLIYKNLNDNGLVIFRTPNGQGIFAGTIIYGDLTHQTILTPNSIVQLLKQAGFDKINCFENGPIPKNLKGIMRKILWGFFKSFLNLFRLCEIGGTIKILSQDFYAYSIKS